MSDVIICAENIGKRYVLNHQPGGVYRKFSESLIYAAKARLRHERVVWADLTRLLTHQTSLKSAH